MLSTLCHFHGLLCRIVASWQQPSVQNAPVCASPQAIVSALALNDESTGALIAVVAERRANAALRSSWRLSDRISKHGDETEALVHWLAT
jgi:hypothetical protein